MVLCINICLLFTILLTQRGTLCLEDELQVPANVADFATLVKADQDQDDLRIHLNKKPSVFANMSEDKLADICAYNVGFHVMLHGHGEENLCKQFKSTPIGNQFDQPEQESKDDRDLSVETTTATLETNTTVDATPMEEFQTTTTLSPEMSTIEVHVYHEPTTTLSSEMSTIEVHVYHESTTLITDFQSEEVDSDKEFVSLPTDTGHRGNNLEVEPGYNGDKASDVLQGSSSQNIILIVIIGIIAVGAGLGGYCYCGRKKHKPLYNIVTSGIASRDGPDPYEGCELREITIDIRNQTAEHKPLMNNGR